ncbi:MAG TPA: nucleoside monophosphate kinase [Verrucomicrobiota bacterium]|nr:nucleoside monophosphate kinase [Verrucomicrobiota bacterium]
MSRYRTILLFGAPGSGKGTQGKILGKLPGYYHFACGDVFRNLRTEDELGRVFREHAGRGELVPDEPTIKLWRRTIHGYTLSGAFLPNVDTLVLDGIPRNVRQAELLHDTLDVRAVFFLTCDDMDKMVERLQRRALRENRLDDANIEVIRRRLVTYENESKPVLEFYGPALVHAINSTQTPLNVLRSILDVLARIEAAAG